MATLDEVRDVLTQNEALIVHFDTNMKDTNAPYGCTDYPGNLKSCCVKPHISIAACTVFANSFDDILPFGRVGLILTPITGASVFSVIAATGDGGTSIVNGERCGRGVEHPTIHDLRNHVNPNGCYTEWVMTNFNVIGLFLYERFDLRAWKALPGSLREPIELTITDVIATFPNLRVFTIENGNFQKIDPLYPHRITPVTYKEIYGWP